MSVTIGTIFDGAYAEMSANENKVTVVEFVRDIAVPLIVYLILNYILLSTSVNSYFLMRRKLKKRTTTK